MTTAIAMVVNNCMCYILMDRCCMKGSTIRSVTVAPVRQAPKPRRACCLPTVQSVTLERYYSRQTEQHDLHCRTSVTQHGGDTHSVICVQHSMPLWSWMTEMWTCCSLAVIHFMRASIQTATLTR